jgi:hypothetical protein
MPRDSPFTLSFNFPLQLYITGCLFAPRPSPLFQCRHRHCATVNNTRGRGKGRLSQPMAVLWRRWLLGEGRLGMLRVDLSRKPSQVRSGCLGAAGAAGRRSIATTEFNVKLEMRRRSGRSSVKPNSSLVLVESQCIGYATATRPIQKSCTVDINPKYTYKKRKGR